MENRYVVEPKLDTVFSLHHCIYWDEDLKECELGEWKITNFEEYWERKSGYYKRGLTKLGKINLEKRKWWEFNDLIGYCRFGKLWLCIKEYKKNDCKRYRREI